MENETAINNRWLFWLSLKGLVLILIFAAIFALSKPYEYGSGLPQPTPTIVALLLSAVVVAVFGQAAAIRCISNRKLVFLVVGFAVSVRLVALFTCPILEIDYYRYLWDGKVIATGTSPYTFSPLQVIQAHSAADCRLSAESPVSDINKLVALSTESESNHTILNRIHFSEYSTIYPPVSQAVFGLAMRCFPSTASVVAHVMFIKAVLVAFDLAILWLVLLALARLRLHLGWSLSYAWNPLVIKEIANGGHLDSIAAFFLMLSVFMLVVWFSRKMTEQSWHLPAASAFALGLGFGAKLFPVVLFPALLITIARVRKSNAVLFGAVFVATGAITFLPMYLSIAEKSAQQDDQLAVKEVPQDTGIAEWGGLPPSPSDIPSPEFVEPESKTKKEGLTSFLSTWRMNDVIFSGIYLNLKPSASDPPWYVVTSDDFRNSIDDVSAEFLPDNSNRAFALTRLMTLGLFSVFYIVQLVAIYRQPFKRDNSEAIGSDASNAETTQLDFHRLVWISVVFLFLQPTVNPWYWVWIAPLSVFCRNRGWLIVGGLLLVYYSRFWFQANPDSMSISNYTGIELYDHCVVWFPFTGIVAAILFFHLYRSSRS